jgi:hypothetical protein
MRTPFDFNSTMQSPEKGVYGAGVSLLEPSSLTNL